MIKATVHMLLPDRIDVQKTKECCWSGHRGIAYRFVVLSDSMLHLAIS
jgi:hypothetical protein